jgi:transcription elongation factor Elf1
MIPALLQPFFLLAFSIISTGAYTANRWQLFFDSDLAIYKMTIAAGFLYSAELMKLPCSESPPTVKFLKANISPCVDVRVKVTWGIYLVIMEKNGAPARVYIGQATGVRGVYQRVYTHKTISSSTTDGIRDAAAEGWKVTSAGTLFQCGVPPIALQPKVRLLLTIMEATIHCLLWSLKSKETWYGFSHLCPWQLTSIEYDGLNSHNPLLEWPGDAYLPELSPEQVKKLEELEALKKEQTRERKRVYDAALTADPEYHAYRLTQHAEYREKMADTWKGKRQKAIDDKEFYCKACDHPFASATELKTHERTELHAKNTGNLDDWSPSHARLAVKKNKEDKRFFCKPCGLPCASEKELELHEESNLHKKVASMRPGDYKFFCEDCRYPTDNRRHYNAHMKSGRHAERVERNARWAAIEQEEKDQV